MWKTACVRKNCFAVEHVDVGIYMNMGVLSHADFTCGPPARDVTFAVQGGGFVRGAGRVDVVPEPRHRLAQFDQGNVVWVSTEL